MCRFASLPRGIQEPESFADPSQRAIVALDAHPLAPIIHVLIDTTDRGLLVSREVQDQPAQIDADRVPMIQLRGLRDRIREGARRRVPVRQAI